MSIKLFLLCSTFFLFGWIVASQVIQDKSRFVDSSTPPDRFPLLNQALKQVDSRIGAIDMRSAQFTSAVNVVRSKLAMPPVSSECEIYGNLVETELALAFLDYRKLNSPLE